MPTQRNLQCSIVFCHGLPFFSPPLNCEGRFGAIEGAFTSPYTLCLLLMSNPLIPFCGPFPTIPRRFLLVRVFSCKSPTSFQGPGKKFTRKPLYLSRYLEAKKVHHECSVGLLRIRCCTREPLSISVNSDFSTRREESGNFGISQIPFSSFS